VIAPLPPLPALPQDQSDTRRAFEGIRKGVTDQTNALMLVARAQEKLIDELSKRVAFLESRVSLK
jgi:hypothetical protein